MRVDTIEYIDVIGLQVNAIDYEGALQQCIILAGGARPAAVSAANTHIAATARHQPSFSRIMNEFDLILPDGMPLVWVMNRALKKEGRPVLRDRVYGPYFMQFAIENAPEGTSHFFFGGSEDCLNELQGELKVKRPDLCVAGMLSPPYREWSEEDLESFATVINDADADFVWVALGGEKQEQWIIDNLHRFKRGVFFAIGDAFELLARRRSFAPDWCQRYGVTWLYRLLQEPRRMWRRYLRNNSLFLYYLMDGLFCKPPPIAANDYHGALAPLRLAVKACKSKVILLENPLLGGKFKILIGHHNLAGKICSLPQAEIALVREFSTLPLLMVFFRLRDRCDKTLYLVNHNVQRAIYNPIERWAFRRLVKSGARFVFLEMKDESFFISLGIVSEKHFDLPHPVDTENSLTKKQVHFRTKPLVGILGQFRREKDIDSVLNVLVGLDDQFDLVLGFPNVDEFKKNSRFSKLKLDVRDTSDSSLYFSLLAECDLLLVCGTERGYRLRASGLISDAAAVGTMVLAPAFPVIEHQVNWPVSIGNCYASISEIPAKINELLGRKELFDGAFESYRAARSADAVGAVLDTHLQYLPDLDLHSDILGIQVSGVDVSDVLSLINAKAHKREPALINNVNAHACNLAYQVPEFKQVLNASDVVFCDGFGVKLAARIRNKKLGVRMTPPDWIDHLFSLCATKGYTFFFVGDHGEIVDLFARMVKERHAGVRIVGTHHGYFDIGGDADLLLRQLIKDSRADIIITGMGMPRQELWAAEVKDQLGQGIYIATGSMFRWYTRSEFRAPRYLTDRGFEWLVRLLLGPIKHFKRYVIGLPLFFWRVLMYRSKNG